MLIVAVCSCDNLKAACSTVKSCFLTNMHCKVCWMPELVGRKYAYHRNLLVQTCRKMNLFYLQRLKWENTCTGNIFDCIKLSCTCTLMRVIQKVFVPECMSYFFKICLYFSRFDMFYNSYSKLKSSMEVIVKTFQELYSLLKCIYLLLCTCTLCI